MYVPTTVVGTCTYQPTKAQRDAPRGPSTATMDGAAASERAASERGWRMAAGGSHARQRASRRQRWPSATVRLVQHRRASGSIPHQCRRGRRPPVDGDDAALPRGRCSAGPHRRCPRKRPYPVCHRPQQSCRCWPQYWLSPASSQLRRMLRHLQEARASLPSMDVASAGQQNLPKQVSLAW